MLTNNRLWLFFGAFILIIFLLNNISASSICWVANSTANCQASYGGTGKVVMHVSDVTNAHSELVSQSSYNDVLCCNFGGGDTTCSSTLNSMTGQPINKILGLAYITNSHAESGGLTLQYANYNTNNVCYDSTTSCQPVPANPDGTFPNCGTNQTAIIQISSGLSLNYTNAHVESAGLSNYRTEICCKVSQSPPPSPCKITLASWSTTQIVVGNSVKLNVATSNCQPGTQISFSVFRHGGGSPSCSSITGCTDPSPSTISVDSNGNAVLTWASGPADNNSYYFVASLTSDSSIKAQSNDLSVLSKPPVWCQSVTDCSNYLNQSTCTNPDICNIANNIDPNCGTSGVSCSCYWNASANLCNDSISYTPTHYHAECQNSKCVLVQGDGVTSCGVVGASCTIPTPNYAMCVGTTCMLVNGSGTNSCSLDADCINNTNNPAHAECQNSKCVEVAGDGNTSCAIINYNCSIPAVYYNSCVSQLCMLTNGTGTSQCSIGQDCVNLQQNSSIGTCYYHAASNGTCQGNQFLTVSLSSRWVWANSGVAPVNGLCDSGYVLGSDGNCHYDPQSISVSCVAKTENLQCPTQIPLPFFTFYNMIAVLLIIAAVYVAIGVMKKKKVRIKIV
jgi:hypothetical protein